MLRALLKDSVIYAIPMIVSRGLSLLLIPLYTRVLTPADYGVLDLFAVFASLVNLTVALEVSQAVARYYVDEKDQHLKVLYASSAFWFTLFCYFLFAILTFLFSDFFIDIVIGASGYEHEFELSIIYIFLNGVFYLIQNQFRWEFRSKSYLVVSLLMSIGTAGMAIFLTYVFEKGLSGLIMGMIFGVGLAGLFGLWQLKESFTLQFNLDRLKEMLFFSAPLVPSGVAVFISFYADRIMINHYLTVDDVGLYGMGFRIASIVGLIMVGVQGALTPLVYKHYKEPNTPEKLARLFRLFVAAALLLYTIITLYAAEILMVMTTSAYLSAEQVIVYLVPAVLFAQMYIFAPGIGIAKKTKYILYVNLLGATLNVLLNWILIPLHGIQGAAFATLLSYFLSFSIHMSISQRFYYIPTQWVRIAIASVLTILIMLMAVLSEDMLNDYMNENVLKMSLIFVLSIFIYFLKLVNGTDLKALYSMVAFWQINQTR